MFKSNYHFHGSHAVKARLLKNPSGNEESPTFFNRLADVYIVSPIIGFTYGIRAIQEKSDDKANVMAEQVIRVKDSLVSSYRLIMLLDEEYEPNVNKRIDNAFRFTDSTDVDSPLAQNLVRFNQYVLGGVDKLYEKLIEPSILPDSYLENLYRFLDEASERWQLPGASEKLDNMIDLARY